MVGLDVYWLGVDYNVVGYYNVAGNYRLGISGLGWSMSICGVLVGSTRCTWLIVRDNCRHLFLLILCVADGTRLYSFSSSLQRVHGLYLPGHDTLLNEMSHFDQLGELLDHHSHTFF